MDSAADLQTRVQLRIDELVASGQETGVQVAAYGRRSADGHPY